MASVGSGSLAGEAGILPGDLITSINGHAISDIVDYRFYSAEEDAEVVVRRGDREFTAAIQKGYDDPLGVEFADDLFDGVRTCGNRCIFCFVDQLPRGMRRSLYLKDDDYRLSFLHGNFVTLTNADEADIRRIIEQRLSPLYVSVHTTEPELRRGMFGSRSLPDVRRQLRTLADGAVTLHTQIVICPGTNDGEHLELTVRDLASLHPGVASIGVVPVGLTRHRRTSPTIQAVDSSGARAIIARVRDWQQEFRTRFGTRLLWASDELYLAAGLPVPSRARYESFPQIENGIGMVRRFMDDARRTVRRLPDRIPHPIRATIVTSTLAAPLLRDFAAALSRVENLSVRVIVIRSKFFGESVTVAGLLTGSDIRDQLRGHDLGDVVLLPSTMLRDGALLDDVALDDLSAAIGRPVVAVEPTPRALVRSLCGRSGPAQAALQWQENPPSVHN